MNAPAPTSRDTSSPAVSGPGACCVEAQADGVPCTEIRDCEVCGRAHPVAIAPAPPARAE